MLIACSRRNIEIAEILLRAGARVNISNLSDYSTLHLTPQEIEISTESNQVDSIIECAMDTTDFEILEDPHTSSLPVSHQPIKDIIRGNALDIAVIQGNAEMVSLLLQYEAKVHSIYYLFRSVILKQARDNIKNRVSITANFFRATVLQQEKEIGTENLVLSSSLWEQYYTIFQLLFSHDSNLIHRVQSTNPSTLYMACAFGVISMVELLLELGMGVSDLYRTDENEMSYWSNLITIISSESLLSSATLKQNTNGEIVDLLCQVGWSGNEKILSMLMGKGLDVNHKDSLGTFVLGIASREGHTKLVEWLLNLKRAKVNQQDNDGVSSLMEACAGGYVPIYNLLLRFGAKVDLQDKKGWSALMFVVAGGYIDLVMHLLREGAQVNLQDVCGTSPLMLSCFIGHVDITSILLAHNANVDLQNDEGITALMMSSYRGHTEIIELLLGRYGANMSTVTNIGMTALDFSKNAAVTTLLEELGGKPSLLGKRTASIRDPTVLSTRVILHNIKDLQDQQIKKKLQLILRAFLPRPSSDHDNSDLLYFELGDKPKLRDALRLFHDFAYNWEAIGTSLGIQGNKIEEIRYDCFGESKACLSKLLEIWLQQVVPPPTWGELKEAVESATDGTIDIPRKITRKQECKYP